MSTTAPAPTENEEPISLDTIVEEADPAPAIDPEAAFKAGYEAGITDGRAQTVLGLFNEAVDALRDAQRKWPSAKPGDVITLFRDILGYHLTRSAQASAVAPTTPEQEG